MKWKASKCLKSSGGCRGRVGRGKEASRGLGALEAGPAAGGRRAGSEMGNHRALSYLCSQNKRPMVLGVEPGQKLLFLHKVASAKQTEIIGPIGGLSQVGKQRQEVHS